jgi:CRP/FNR family transcriptional regulator, cyclic AMP receptor protein
MEWPMWFAYVAVISSVITSYMKTMVPLRIVSILCNSCFLVYGFSASVYPTLVLNSILLPLNAIRLYQMLQLVKKAEQAAEGDLSLDWLRPFMSRRQCVAGDVLFHKGDPADTMFYVASGRFRLAELDVEILPRQVVGELGFLAPDNRRTQTLVCTETGEVLTITYQKVKELYYQNPQFGFYFLQLTSERLFDNVARLERQLGQERAALQPQPA